MNKNIPTTLELLDLACSREEGYASRTTILDVDMPCMDTEMNRFFRSVCRNWDFSLEQVSNLPDNKMRVYHKGKAATRDDIKAFARYILVNNNVKMFNSNDRDDYSIHFEYMRGPLMREVHIELALTGHMIVHTKIA